MSEYSPESKEYMLLSEVFSEDSREAEIRSVENLETGDSQNIGYEVDINGYLFYLILPTDSQGTYETITTFCEELGLSSYTTNTQTPVGEIFTAYFHEGNSEVSVNSPNASTYRLCKPDEVTVVEGHSFDQLNNELELTEEYEQNNRFITREINSVDIDGGEITASVVVSDDETAEFTFEIPDRPDPENSNESHFIETVGNGVPEYISGKNVVLVESVDYGDEIRPVTRSENTKWYLTSPEAYNNREEYKKTQQTSNNDEENSDAPLIDGRIPAIVALVIMASLVTLFIATLAGYPLGTDAENADVEIEFTETESGLEAELVDADTAHKVYIAVPLAQEQYYIDRPNGEVTISDEMLKGEEEVHVVAENPDGSAWIVDTYALNGSR